MTRKTMLLRRVPTVTALALGLAVVSACKEVVLPEKPVTRDEIAQLWAEPPAGRDLFLGVGGRQLLPDPNDVYKVIEIKASGYSDGYTVVDSQKREWSAKFPPEASTEVVASRLLWGIGYHQPPIYLL